MCQLKYVQDKHNDFQLLWITSQNIYIVKVPKDTFHQIVVEYLKRVEDENAPHDRVVWNIGRVQNNAARSKSDDVTANRVRFEIVAQVNITVSTCHILLELFIFMLCRNAF